jgi:galactose mutarotase-like enzyme
MCMIAIKSKEKNFYTVTINLISYDFVCIEIQTHRVNSRHRQHITKRGLKLSKILPFTTSNFVNLMKV